jgi:hypothetical protein
MYIFWMSIGVKMDVGYLLCGGGFINMVSWHQILFVKPAPTIRVNLRLKQLQIYLLA